MSSFIKSDVTIVGGGLIGSALALWLAKHSDHSITLVELNDQMSLPKQANQRVIALGALATDFLDQIGVLRELDAQHCHSYQKMFVWDSNSNGELCFEADQIGEARLGHMIDSQMCTYRLQQAVLNSKVNCYFGVQTKSLRLTDTSAILETDVDNFKANLLVAADGSRSWIRQQAKIFANHHSYDQQGIVATIETEESHQDCAWQTFLESGPVAVLPLANNQSSIVWSANNALAEKLLAMTDDEFESALSQALDGRLGSVTLKSKRQAFPLGSMQAESYFRRNLALVGDAAHSIHPLAGQGANLGFKDAKVLAKLMVNSEASALGNPRLLSVYQKKRQSDNRQTDLLMSALHQAYQLDLPLWMLVRGLGMNVINGSDVLRDALARQAMGI